MASFAALVRAEMTDKHMTTEEKKAHKAEYDRARRMRNLKEAKESASAKFMQSMGWLI